MYRYRLPLISLMIAVSLNACGSASDLNQSSSTEAQQPVPITGTWVGQGLPSDPVTITLELMPDGRYQTSHFRNGIKQETIGKYAITDENQLQMEYSIENRPRTETLEFTIITDTLILRDQENEILELTRNPAAIP